jgi:hypothetical protein
MHAAVWCTNQVTCGVRLQCSGVRGNRVAAAQACTHQALSRSPAVECGLQPSPGQRLACAQPEARVARRSMCLGWCAAWHAAWCIAAVHMHAPACSRGLPGPRLAGAQTVTGWYGERHATTTVPPRRHVCALVATLLSLRPLPGSQHTGYHVAVHAAMSVVVCRYTCSCGAALWSSIIAAMDCCTAMQLATIPGVWWQRR